MAPTPAHLRAAAEGLRATARRLDLDLAPLADKGDHQTWQGPAATAYRRTATDVGVRGGVVTAGLRRIAGRLEATAVEVEQAEVVARARAEEARAAADADRTARARGQAELDRRTWPGLDDALAPPPSTGDARVGSAPGPLGDLLRTQAHDDA